MSSDADEWRVEVDLDDDEHGYSLTERLRSLDLDDEARERLGRSIIVTRDGARMFLYGQTAPQAKAAEAVVLELMTEHQLTGTVAMTRWHPIEAAWKDAAIPLPQTDAERAAEEAALEQAERQEIERDGSYDWIVRIGCPGHGDATALATALAGKGLPIDRHWRWVGVGALTEHRAAELADRFRAELGSTYEISVEVNTADLTAAVFRIVQSAF